MPSGRQGAAGWARVSCFFSRLPGVIVNRVLDEVLGRIGWPSADRYSSHGFHRGTSHALKEAFPSWSVVATSGVWNSPAFRGYLDMSKDLEQGFAQLFAADFNSDSAEEEPAEA